MSHLSAQTQSVWWVAGVNCGTTQTIWDFWSISIHSLVIRSPWRQKQKLRERWDTVGSIANNLFSEWVSYSSFILQIVFFVSLIFSAITVFTELTTLLYWVTNKHFSPFRWAYSLSLSHSLRILLGTLSLVYMLILACELGISRSAFSTPISTSQSHLSAHLISILTIRMYLL